MNEYQNSLSDYSKVNTISKKETQKVSTFWRKIISKLSTPNIHLPPYYSNEVQEHRFTGKIDKLFNEYFSGPIGRTDIIILDKITDLQDVRKDKRDQSIDQSNFDLSQTINDVRIQNER